MAFRKKYNSIILGVDPGLGNFGVAAVNVNRELCATAVVTTKPDKRLRYKSGPKRWSYPVRDMLRRVRELHGNLSVWFSTTRDWHPVAVCSESPSFGMQGVIGVRQSAMAWGVLVSLAAMHRIPLVVMGRQLILKMVCGRTGSKEDPLPKSVVVDAVSDLYGGYDEWPTPRGLVHHAADAAAAVWVMWNDDIVTAARR